MKQYLLDKVTLLHIHRFDPNNVQFDDALVSSAVVWFRKTTPPERHKVRFSYGGSLEQPKLDKLLPVDQLRHEPKWTCYPMRKIGKRIAEPVLSDLFDIKRGLATGGNNISIAFPYRTLPVNWQVQKHGQRSAKVEIGVV